ncbi:MAG TPA: alpha/beta fold hydrolase [Usitatibacter sp.]|nr:alpha/beta fold hydrolase [Usitatibacter sp.]
MIFLHGANSGAVELAPLVEALRPYATVRTPDLLGHGGRPLAERMNTREMADDVLAWMDREGIESEVIGGYSFGGTLALYLARHHPQRVRGVIALVAKHIFDAATIGRWLQILDHERIAQVKFPWGTRVEELTRIHAPNRWQDVARASSRLFESLREPPLTPQDLRAIQAPTMIVSSNVDQVVPWEEALALGKLVPGSHLAMFYGPGHPLRAIPLAAVARTIDQWMGTKGLRHR